MWDILVCYLASQMGFVQVSARFVRLSTAYPHIDTPAESEQFFDVCSRQCSKKSHSFFCGHMPRCVKWQCYSWNWRKGKKKYKKLYELNCFVYEERKTDRMLCMSIEWVSAKWCTSHLENYIAVPLYNLINSFDLNSTSFHIVFSHSLALRLCCVFFFKCKFMSERKCHNLWWQKKEQEGGKKRAQNRIKEMIRSHLARKSSSKRMIINWWALWKNLLRFISGRYLEIHENKLNSFIFYSFHSFSFFFFCVQMNVPCRQHHPRSPSEQWNM